MQLAETSAQVVMEELERVLASAGFVRNERLTRFLRVSVEWKLAGKAEELKESVLGVEVFGRSPGYDPKRDPVVRTEASRLRARLNEYYSTVGADSRLVIDLPKGGYAPEWRWRDQVAVVRKTELPRPSLALVLGILLAVLCIVGWRWIEGTRKPISIAVLPLKNLSDNPSTNFFSDGLTGEIIRNLSMIEGLAVRSQTSSFAFKNKSTSAQETGKELGADYVLAGSVYRDGNQLRVQVQLVKVAENRYVWTESYDRDSSQVFKIQDEISRGIVNSLRLNLGRGRRKYETSVEAYDLYLQARALQINAVFGDPRSIGLFERAIEKDPAFAPAYAGVSTAYAERSEFPHPTPDGVQQDLMRMRATAEKALELDPLLPEAHEAGGMAFARDGRWEQAEIHFRRAAELDPSDSKIRSHYGCNYYLALGQVQPALEQLRFAEKSDPLSAQVHYRLGYILMSAGQFEEAEKQCAMMQTDPGRKSQCVGRAKLMQGRIEEAIRDLQKADYRELLVYALALSGRRAEAEKLHDTLPPDTLTKAFLWAALGDKEKLLGAIANSAWAGPVLMGRVLTFPEFRLIRGDARLKEIYRKTGLPD